MHRQLLEFLEEVDAEFKDIPYHSDERFLSRGIVFFFFFHLLQEIKMFLIVKKKPAEKLDDPIFVRDLAFLADLSVDLNNLNEILQGKNKLITKLYDGIEEFKKQLELSIEQLEAGNVDSFSCLKAVVEEEPTEDNQSVVQKYIKLLQDLLANFRARFADLSRFETDLHF